MQCPRRKVSDTASRKEASNRGKYSFFILTRKWELTGLAYVVFASECLYLDIEVGRQQVGPCLVYLASQSPDVLPGLGGRPSWRYCSEVSFHLPCMTGHFLSTRKFGFSLVYLKTY
jgi:hypothetical protein